MSNSHMPDKTNYSQADTKVFIYRTVEGGEAGQEYSVQVLRTGASKRGEEVDRMGWAGLKPQLLSLIRACRPAPLAVEFSKNQSHFNSPLSL